VKDESGAAVAEVKKLLHFRRKSGESEAREWNGS